MSRIFTLPVVVLMVIVIAAAMVATASIAIGMGDLRAASVFAIYAALSASVSVMAAMAVWGRKARAVVDRDVVSLLTIFVLVPVFAALPFAAIVPDLSFGNAYFEMMSAFTTTGATLFADPNQISEIAHFWRAGVGWLGGLVMLVSAFSLLEPLKIGGFEMHEIAWRVNRREERGSAQADPANRLMRTVRQIVPIYLGLTVFLSCLLASAGDSAFVAVCHAMSILSTSGISPIGGLQNAPSGGSGEILILAFLALALTNRVYGGSGVFGSDGALREPEVQTGIVLIGVATLVLFLRHYIFLSNAAPDSSEPSAALYLAWGILFTATSFLTTTGFTSSSWEASVFWSEMPAIGLIMFCLVLAGGGIATTAGGLKLLRIFALYKHGVREIERLVHPSSVGGYGVNARRIRREGAFVAWIFVMLFLLTFGCVSILLSLAGTDFVSSLVLAMAALANAGPLTTMFGQDVPQYSEISSEARGIFCAAMLIGRVEVLAVVAVLNPEYWRR